MENIYQGGNAPIILEFDEDMTNIPGMSIGIYYGKTKLLKHWTKDDVAIDKTIVSCPITQEESAAWPEGTVCLEIKLLASDGSIIFFTTEYLIVHQRCDKKVTL